MESKGFPTLVAATVMLWAPLPWAAEPMRYVYPPPLNKADHRFDYYWEMLEAALEITRGAYGSYELAPYPEPMNAARAINMMSRSSDITVLTITTDLERERILLPLRIPVDKGLTGYRLFLIQAQMQPRLDKVRSLSDLSSFIVGQGTGWVDAQILRNAGLKVEQGASYGGLFDMLVADRFQLFPRGVNEIRAELAADQPSHPKTAIEKNLMLYYPLPRYFFFSRTEHGQALAKRIEVGLHLLEVSGEFDLRISGLPAADIGWLELNRTTAVPPCESFIAARNTFGQARTLG